MGSPGKAVKKAAKKTVKAVGNAPRKQSQKFINDPFSETGKHIVNYATFGTMGSTARKAMQKSSLSNKVDENLRDFVTKPSASYVKGFQEEAIRNPGLTVLTGGLTATGAGLRDMGKSYMAKQGVYAGQGEVAEVLEVPKPQDQAETDRIAFLEAKRRRELQRGGPSLLNQRVNRQSLLGANGF